MSNIPKNYRDSVTSGLVEELIKTVYKYVETMPVATAVGCLEMAKLQIIDDQKAAYDDDE